MSCPARIWEQYGLPGALLRSYGYRASAGVARTPWDDGSHRQRRRIRPWPAIIEVAIPCTVGDLQTLSVVLDTYGPGGIEIPITTEAGECVWHRVRLISDYRVVALSRGIYEVNAFVRRADISKTA